MTRYIAPSGLTAEQLREFNLTAQQAAAVTEALETVTEPEAEGEAIETVVVGVGAYDWAPGPGQYLWTRYPDGRVTMAWRREPGDAWGPPIEGKRA